MDRIHCRAPNARRTLISVVIALFSLFLLDGCGTRGASEAFYGGERSMAAEEDMDVRSSGAAFPPEEPSPQPAVSASSAAASPGSSETAAEARPRLRVYSADLLLSVGRVTETKDRIIALADDVGGYVEYSSGSEVTIRVPVESFEAVLTEIEGYGRLESKSVRTTDVTDQYADLQRRLEVAQTSRDRLYQLLERTQDADERVEILKEIRRLSEEIERYQSALSSLDQLIRFSRITVSLQSQFGTTRQMRSRIPFRWIASLSPTSQTLDKARSRIPISISDDFAVFEDGKLVIAEAADGTRLRVGATDNEPVGDTAFWSEALSHHLGPLYPAFRGVSAGGFSGVILESGAPDPSVYVVLVSANEREIIVGEIFIPGARGDDPRIDELVDAFEEVEP